MSHNPKSKEGARVAKLTDRELFDEQQEKKKKPSKNKMGNKPIVIDAIWFQSTGEGHYYQELKSRLQNGEFAQFKRQLPVEFFVNGIRVGRYIADFAVLNHDGSIDIIDYKSRFTVMLAHYKLKKALMLACYQVEIKEVGKR